MEGGIQKNLGFNHTFTWPRDHRGQCPGERARERTIANSQLPPRSLGWARKQNIRTSLSQVCRVAPFQWCLLCLASQHCLLTPASSSISEDQRDCRLQVLSLPLGEQTSGSADGKKPQLCMPCAHLCILQGTCISIKTQTHKPTGDWVCQHRVYPSC